MIRDSAPADRLAADPPAARAPELRLQLDLIERHLEHHRELGLLSVTIVNRTGSDGLTADDGPYRWVEVRRLSSSSNPSTTLNRFDCSSSPNRMAR